MPSTKTIVTTAVIALVTMALVSRVPQLDKVVNDKNFLGI